MVDFSCEVCLFCLVVATFPMCFCISDFKYFPSQFFHCKVLQIYSYYYCISIYAYDKHYLYKSFIELSKSIYYKLNVDKLFILVKFRSGIYLTFVSEKIAACFVMLSFFSRLLVMVMSWLLYLKFVMS